MVRGRRRADSRFQAVGRVGLTSFRNVARRRSGRLGATWGSVAAPVRPTLDGLAGQGDRTFTSAGDRAAAPGSCPGLQLRVENAFAVLMRTAAILRVACEESLALARTAAVMPSPGRCQRLLPKPGTAPSCPRTPVASSGESSRVSPRP